MQAIAMLNDFKIKINLELFKLCSVSFRSQLLMITAYKINSFTSKSVWNELVSVYGDKKSKNTFLANRCWKLTRQPEN